VHPVIPVLQLVSVLERIEGRKKLQKTVHILRELGVPFQERFEYSFYGMYSSQLKGEIDILERDGLLNQDIKEGANPTYIIESTPKLKKLLEELAIAPPAWIDLAQQLNNLSAQVLEGMSTILFLRRTEKGDAAIRAKLLSLKPHLADLADKCFAEVANLPILL
jgi:uncharacterized protein YwgA